MEHDKLNATPKKNKPADTPREQISFANFPQLQAHENSLKNEIETAAVRVRVASKWNVKIDFPCNIKTEFSVHSVVKLRIVKKWDGTINCN